MTTAADSKKGLIAAVAAVVAVGAAFAIITKRGSKCPFAGKPAKASAASSGKCPFSSGAAVAPSSAPAGKCPFSGATLPATEAAPAKCPFSGASAPTASAPVASAGKCPFSGATLPAADASAHPHGHGHGAPVSHAAAIKARMDSIMPFQPRMITPEQLARCTGAHEDPLGLRESATDDVTAEQLEDDLAVTRNMVCISSRGVVYKVTPQFYGVGEGYSVYAGKDITRSLAIGLVTADECSLPWSDASAKAYKAYHGKATPTQNPTRAVEALADEQGYDGEFTAEELNTLDLWAKKYDKKYQIVGWYAPFAKANTNKDGEAAPHHVCKSMKDVLTYVLGHVDVKANKSCEDMGSKAPITTRRLRHMVGGTLPEGVV